MLPVPETALSVAVFVGEPGRRTPTSSSSTSARTGKVRGRDAVLLRDGEQVATVVDLPWEEDDPTQLERARAVDGRLVLAGGLGPENVRRGDRGDVGPWAVDASSSLESSPGVKDHDARARLRGGGAAR